MAQTDPWNWPVDWTSPTREQFLGGRRRRYPLNHPERNDDPFKLHMVETQRDPYFLREEYDWSPGDSCSVSAGRDETAIWSFARVGRTTTLVDDRMIVYIGGGHDDGYDPDFLIYNDVVVRGVGGGLTIYEYPKPVFPPTDFHTATVPLADPIENYLPGDLKDTILIIGGLGYEEDREFWRTPIYRLCLDSYRIEPRESKGEEPGWIFGHTASLLAGDKILVCDGKVLNEAGITVSNPSTHLLDLSSMVWKKLSVGWE